MPSERFYIDHILNAHEEVILDGAEYHHLAHVMKIKKGEEVELVNGKGGLAIATLLELNKKNGRLKIEKFYQESPAPCKIILAQAFAKQNRLDFIIEKGTELGVDQFWLFPGEFSQKKDFYPSQIERCHQLTIAALKQSGRLYLPEIKIYPNISQWLPHRSSLLFGDVDSASLPFQTVWEKTNPTLPIIFVTGPESGLSENEEKYLRQIGTGVKLNSNILRTETASITALSLLSHWLISK